MTLAWIQAVQLELVDAGTSKAKLQFRVSERLPLLYRDNFERWIHSNGDGGMEKGELNEITNELYPQERTLPFGFSSVLMPAIRMSPKGSWSLASSNITNDAYALINVFLDYSLALRFMHEKGIFHNDVSPTNTLIYKNSSGEQRGLLIDFSASTQSGKALNGFVGNVLYAHTHAHSRNQTWHPEPNYDFVSLGFTLAAICSQYESSEGEMLGAEQRTFQDNIAEEKRKTIAKKI